MPYLIDGNNLLHALHAAGIDVGRGEMCGLMATLARQDPQICVVFDGFAPSSAAAKQIAGSVVEVSFSAGRSADDVIEDRIAASSAPRRLVVVSSDRRLVRAARHRRCPRQTSQEFIQTLLAAARRANRPKAPEPPEKRAGLTPDQTDQWMRLFGFRDSKD